MIGRREGIWTPGRGCPLRFSRPVRSATPASLRSDGCHDARKFGILTVPCPCNFVPVTSLRAKRWLSGPGKYKNQHIKLPFPGGKHYRSPFNVSDRTGNKANWSLLPNVFYSKTACSLYRALSWIHWSCRIALLFCLPVLELGLEWLDGFHEVLIYPAPFCGRWWMGRRYRSGAQPTYCSVRSELAAKGPIVLNWLDIQDSFDASGFNLIIHGVAHKLDTRNGDRASGSSLYFVAWGCWLGTRSSCCNEQHSGRNRGSWWECGEHWCLCCQWSCWMFCRYFLNISLAPQNFLLLRFPSLGNVSCRILSTRSFAGNCIPR